MKFSGAERPRPTFGTLMPPMVIVMVAVLPLFLVGVLARQLREEFQIDPAGLGWLAASFGGGGAVTGISGGRLTSRIGPSRSLRISLVASASSMFAIAIIARSTWMLAILLAVAGASYTLAQVATSLYFARAIDRRRLGFAFGLRQATVPASMLLAGLAVPTLAVTIGWRWTFAAGAIATGLALVVVREPPPANSPMPDGGGAPSRRALVLLAVGASLAAAGSSAVSTFMVDAATQSGISNSAAALLVVVGSVLGSAGRVVSGVRADRRDGGNLTMVVRVLALAAVLYLALALDQRTVYFLVGPLVFTSTWGWSTLFHLSVVRIQPSNAASAAGLVITGSQIGVFLGPLIIGYVARDTSYAMAWTTAALLLAAAATVVHGARRMLMMTWRASVET